ncbi:MAG TPA: hypothetical protein VNR64_15000, partial [Vicinamibacterales bacterium]|nr:hypothetical protein [Vicinamibacterales bacterium]
KCPATPDTSSSAAILMCTEVQRSRSLFLLSFFLVKTGNGCVPLWETAFVPVFQEQTNYAGRNGVWSATS